MVVWCCTRPPRKYETTSHGVKQTVSSCSLYLELLNLNATKPEHAAHINNLYNTTFWALVQQGGETTTQAHATLRVLDLSPPFRSIGSDYSAF